MTRHFSSSCAKLLEEEENYEVLICREWDGAYQFIKQEKPNVAILDIRIGGEEHGWTILNLITLDPETSHTPTIVCSAAIDSLHEHREQLNAYGIRALPKPFDLDTLLRTIEEVLVAKPT